jgi:hypothetical protein
MIFYENPLLLYGFVPLLLARLSGKYAGGEAIDLSR